MAVLKKLYNWVLSWADSPYGTRALFILALAESSFFPVPPDVLLIALVIGAVRNPPINYPVPSEYLERNNLLKSVKEWGKYSSKLIPWIFKHSPYFIKTFPRSRPFYIAFVCSLGSVIGGILGYCIGYFLWYADDKTFSSIACFFFNTVPGFTEESFCAMKNSYDRWNFWIVFTAGFTPLPYKLITITAGVFSINFLIFCFASFISRSARFFLVAGLIWIFGPPIKAFIDNYFNLLCFLFLFLLISGFIVFKFI
ncbi:MAG: VTT domain-containing protein [Thermodesulfobacteriota bacterium]|nr:VTT domain-containing protein [Thermodesulfobacteriota bacterium]